MERKDRIEICKKVLEGTKFKVRIDWFGDGIIESDCGVTMCDHDTLYTQIFNGGDCIKDLEERLKMHYDRLMRRGESNRALKKREDELRALYLQN